MYRSIRKIGFNVLVNDTGYVEMIEKCVNYYMWPLTNFCWPMRPRRCKRLERVASFFFEKGNERVSRAFEEKTLTKEEGGRGIERRRRRKGWRSRKV